MINGFWVGGVYLQKQVSCSLVPCLSPVPIHPQADLARSQKDQPPCSCVHKSRLAMTQRWSMPDFMFKSLCRLCFPLEQDSNFKRNSQGTCKIESRFASKHSLRPRQRHSTRGKTSRSDILLQVSQDTTRPSSRHPPRLLTGTGPSRYYVARSAALPPPIPLIRVQLSSLDPDT